MALTKKGYAKRLIDDEIEDLLTMFGAISIEGPKYCGKTWTASNHANSSVLLTKSDNPNSDYQRALIDRELIFTGVYPELIDEWQSIEQLWDDVRTKCDETSEKGIFILSGSSVPANQNNIFHSGAGRIVKLNMYTMSLYESGDSEGIVSLKDLLENKNISVNLEKKPKLEKFADLIVRGGWPGSLTFKCENYYRLPESYINDILDHDISYDGVSRDKEKMRMLMRSLARNENTLVTIQKLTSDIFEYSTDQENSVNRNTVADYLNVLSNLHLTKEILPFSEKIRSSIRVGKSSKRQFVDPSLSCAVLGIKQEHLIKDLNFFGLLFESLVIRDLRIYIETLGGKIYHYHENNTGFEADVILELRDGTFGAIEIKLGVGKIDETCENLKQFSEKCTTKPAFLCVISGMIDHAYKREDGIYVVPVTALKP